MHARSLALVALLGAGACAFPATFVCAQDAQCRRGGVTGVCQPAGSCAFADPGCPAQLRYDTTAGDGLAGECVDCAVAGSTWYADADADGHGDPATSTLACAQPAGMVASADDCDDAEPLAYPGASEVCDGIDNNCDPASAESCPTQCTPLRRPAPDDAHVYLVCGMAATWAAAKATCAGAGYRLVRVDDVAEQAWISATKVTRLGNEHIWMGANDVATEGRWVWEDGAQFWSGGPNGMPVGGLYNFWTTGEPAGLAAGENCGVLTNGNGDWDDVGCALTRAFFCERY